MPLLFLLLFIGLPLIEIYFLIQIGGEIGALPTIGLTVLTAIIGTALVRHQGFGVIARVRQASDRGELPALDLFDGALLLLAGLFLLLPGFLTDAVGFLLLVPPVRLWMVRHTVQVVPVSTSRPATPDAERGPRVIEGRFRRED